MKKHEDTSQSGGAHEDAAHDASADKNMLTSILGPFVSFINTVITQAVTLKIARERLAAEEREGALQRSHDKERDEAERQHRRELEAGHQRHEDEREARAQAAKSREEWLRHVYQTQQAKGGLIIEPGRWKAQVFNAAQAGPLILFDKVNADLAGRANLPFDPIQFLAEQFKLQSLEYGQLVKAITTQEGFTSDAHARQFLKREFAEDTMALVYATFSGNRLSFHTLYQGFTAEQLLLVKDEARTIVLPDRMDYALLGRFPLSLFRDLATHYAAQGDAGREAYENAEFLFDLIVNTSLQVLLDEYFACQMFLPFLPRASALFQQKAERLKHLGLWQDALAEKLELLDSRLQALRTHVLTAVE
jgi:hypothetical protein